MNKSSLEQATEAAAKVNVQLKGQFKLPPPNLRKKLSIPLKPKPAQTLLLGGFFNSSPVAKVTMPEQKPRHFTGGKLPEGIELLNSSSYIGFRCTCCDVKLTSEAILKRHIEGAEHQKKSLLKLHCGNITGKKDSQAQQIITTSESMTEGSSRDMSQPVISKKDPEIQNIVVTSPKSTLDQYLAGTSEPIIGLDFVAETQLPDSQPTFYCKLCGITCSPDEIKEHIVGIRHCLMYLQMVEAKKIEEIRNQFKKKSERNQEILKFAAQVEKTRGRGSVKLILPQMLNKEPTKKTDKDGEERKDNHGSVKRALEESQSSSRKKPSFSSDAFESKSYENNKCYSNSHHPNTKQSDEGQGKQPQKHEKKRNRWGGFADPNIIASTKVLSSSVDFTGVTANTNLSLKDNHSSPPTNVARKTSLPKPQPKKPLYKPPRSFLLPSDIINQTRMTQSQPSSMQAVPYPQIKLHSQGTTHSHVSSVKSATIPMMSQKKSSVTSTRNLMPKSQRQVRLNPVKNTTPAVAQCQTSLNSMRNEMMPRVSHQSRVNSVRKEVTSSVVHQARSNPVKNEMISSVSQYQSSTVKNEATSSISQQQIRLNLARNATMQVPSQDQLRKNTTPEASETINPPRSVSEHLITGLLNQSDLKGSNDAEIIALKTLSSFVINDDDDAGNVMEVINSLTQAYLRYKTRALTLPVKELLVQSLKDGGEGLQIILKHHGIYNMKPLENFSDINNDTTRCASNVLRQFSSKWVEEPDDSLREESDDSVDRGASDNLAPNTDAVSQKDELGSIDNNMDDSTNEFKQQFPYSWNENKNSASQGNSFTESSHDWNGAPLRSNSNNIFDR